MTYRTAVAAKPAAKILVVDDDALVAMGMVAMLEDLGHHVIEAHSGAKALTMAQNDASIDLVITDQSMPGMSGTDLAQALGALRPELPVILATGYHDVPESGGLKLQRLTKPYDEQAVARTVASVLGRHST